MATESKEQTKQRLARVRELRDRIQDLRHRQLPNQVVTGSVAECVAWHQALQKALLVHGQVKAKEAALNAAYEDLATWYA